MTVTIPTNGNGRQQVRLSEERQVKHIVIISSHFRSHFRPLFFTALSLVTRFSNLVITVYVVESILSIADEELDLFFGNARQRKHSHSNGSSFSNGESSNDASSTSSLVSDRVRVVGLPSNLDDTHAPDWQQLFKSVYEKQIPAYLRPYWDGNSNRDSKGSPNSDAILNNGNGTNSNGSNAVNGDSHLPLFETAPTMLVFDILIDISKVVEIMAADLGPAFSNVKLIGWAQNPVAWALRRLTAPDVQQKLKLLDCDLDEDSEPSDDSNRHIEDVLMRTDGSIIEVPGSHRCYDYELIPQYGSMEINARNMYTVYKAARNLRPCDGVLFSNCPEFEPDAAAMLEKELGKPVFQIGAQFPLHWRPSPPSKELIGNEQTSSNRESLISDSDLQVRDFLDKIHRTLGSQRVLYISFGSVYSMEKRPDLIETLIQMLLEINSGSDGLQLPFIFTTFTTKDLIPITLRQKIEQAGVGIFCKFAPQHLILRHSATAWFLTHGGSSSVHESIYNAVPLVFWPVTTDQPIGAAQLCLNLNCGIELIQVRTGPSLGRPTLRGVRHRGGSLEIIKTELADMLELIISQHRTRECNDIVKQRALEIRLNVDKIALKMRKSQDTGGSCDLAVKKLYQYL